MAAAAGRALGAIISKVKRINGVGYSTYTTMYNSGVASILDYCAGIWGAGVHTKIDSVQNHTIRFFLGVHNFAPNAAIQGDMGWTQPHITASVLAQQRPGVSYFRSLPMPGKLLLPKSTNSELTGL